MALWLPPGTISGEPLAVGRLEDVNCIYAAEFSHREDETVGPPNLAIAEYLHDRLGEFRERELPVFASKVILDGLRLIDSDVQIADVFDGQSAAGVSENLGTWGEGSQLIDFMGGVAAHVRPLIVTSGYNAGNIARQMRLRDSAPVIPDDLPVTPFDWRSQQLWTKHRLAWALSSHLRITMLERKGH